MSGRQEAPDPQAAHPRQVAQLVAQLVVAGDDGAVQLLQGGASAAHRRLARRAQHAQGLDRPTALLGDLDALSGEGGSSSCDGIESVILAGLRGVLTCRAL